MQSPVAVVLPWLPPLLVPPCVPRLQIVLSLLCELPRVVELPLVLTQ
jgi:hypothetical protein